uniref:G surface protein, allelic form 156 n=1 Tax=Paramecium primaurelia TaxID=5886 RepID=G156_PARPR|nr:RecName: Full=G surface protein, allelic form 156; Flags: Precursor [Paramecium primaurelia]CAA27514.1 unnamed protein product [Paramecium primaurelia]
MNNKFIIFSLLLALVASQTYSLTSCTCAQLLSEGDCIKNVSLGCSWDTTKKTCGVSTTPVTPTVTYAAYCDTFAETDCPKAKPCTDCGNYAACAWVESKCTFFTGCTPFAKTLDSECQAISNRCITDGTHCVEVDACSTYKKQLPCAKNAAGSLCYWDTTNNTCVDANTCDKLPATFATDKDCRDVISTCTTKTGGGCVDSGNNCSDQTLEIQCVWNKLKTTSCYWDGAACKDRICDNAPTSLTTDDACKTFRTDGTCTTKANGGCVTRTTCAAATIQASCIKNSSGGDCYWTGTACVDKACANTPTTIATNSACAGFVTGCITKSGGGCVVNGACSVANVQAACVKNPSNFDCIWDTTCKEKTCANASTTNNTHDLCTSYLSTCTVKSGGGCQNRTCANAPTTMTTNDACEAYFTGNNCITKSGGGCVTNTTCAAITLEAACVKNSSGSTCFWDTASSSCKDKTCVNAPATNTTHDLCQPFLNTCTVNSTSAGCVEKTCENSLVLAICDKDTSSRACIWKGKCYKKQCVLASSATTTHADCQTYHSTCTLSNSGTGCVPLPLKCEAITIEAACNLKANGQPCGWNGSQCIDKACSTASKTFTTTSQCTGHISTCVANNPVTVNGSLTIQGCQDLPTTCARRKSSENCEITRVGFPTCLWVSSSTSCVEKSCATASTVGTTGALSAGGFTFSGCQTYLNTCISNNTADGCIAKPSSCSSLVSSNCRDGSKASGDCYWNGSSCVDKTCANIIQTTHNSCNTTFNQCTVNNGGTACQTLATACTSYSTQENCKFTSTNKNCVWTGLACRNATCADAPDTTAYDSDTECLAYPTPSETCTVVYKVGAQGCVSKSANCSDYMTSAQCHKTLTNLTANDDCKWIVDRCYALSSFATGACTTFKGTKTMCEGYRAGCTNTVGAASSASCTLDCTLKTGSGLTFADCQALDSTCSVKKDGTGCIAIQSTCAGYGSTAANCFRSSASGTAGYCAMNTNCQSVTSAAECAFVTGLTGLDHSKCQLYHSSCTSLKDGTGCQEYKTTCSGYAATNNCATSGQGKCFFDVECLRFSNCASITGTGLTTAICGTYDAGCVANVNGTACQEKLATCDLYLTQNSCSTSAAAATADKCAWSGTACLAVTTVGTHCPYVTGTGLTDLICAAYNANCTANKAGTACQEKKATCNLYTTEATCSTSAAAATADKCAWSGAACLAVTTVATECAYVTGTGLTDLICAAYNANCTANKAGTACQEKKATCNLYTTEATCSTSAAAATADKCAWSGAACLAVTTVATECAYVTGTGLTNAICAAYNANCTANKAGTACQEKKATCNLYTTEATCSTSAAAATADKCAWSGAACLAVTTVATECAYVTGTGLTNAICAAYNANCTANKAGTACQEKKATCNLYTTEATCSTSAAAATADKCAWSGAACLAVTTVATECAYVTGTGLTKAICATYNAGCINLKDGTGCQEAKANCKDYTTSNKCTAQTTSTLSCLWIDNSCYPVTDLNCSVITGLGFVHAQCQAYSTGCTSVSDGSKCQDFKSTCEQYPGTTLGCTKTASTKCYLQGSACITISNVATDCAKITGSAGTITFEICQSYNTGCSVNRARSACVQQQAQCSGYTSAMTSCYKSGAGLCIASTNTDTACVAATAATCDAVYLGAGNYSSANCNEMKAGCTNNGTTACVAKTCANAAGITFNHTNCNSYLNTCTVNSGNSACQTMASKCADQTQASCLYSVEGECVVVGTSCVRKTCDTAATDATRDDDTECSTYQQSCTVARLGACQARAACATYKSSLQCKFNTSGGKCFWNPTNKTCVDLNCGNIEATTLYDTHNECVAVDATLACTVRATNGAAAQGCMARGACASYTIEEQCKTNASNGVCVWNTNANLPAPACQDKSCTSAPTSTTTHNDCYAYYNTATVKCTVVATPSNSGGNPTLGGCQQTAACSSYIDKEQCQINANGDPCGWNGTQCADKSCATASATADYDDDTKCRAYITNKCTVSDSGQGCVEIPATCETMTQKQCYYNKAGDPCYWTGTACITKSCDNAPDATATADECNTYLAGCTLNNVKCKTKVCEDFAFATDALCKQAISTCTTNGTNCVTRGTCFQALSQAGCVTSSTNQQCEWIPAVLNASNVITSPAYCTIKNCSTAPITLTSEAACAGYFTNCTTKNGGGCVTKSTCSAVTIDVACTTALNGTVCAWDSAQNKCRDKDCQDFSGTTHAACQAQRAGCTAGAGGKCARVQNCEQTSVRAACIEGTNGPCLWIDKYQNTDGTKGACFRYTSCKSLNWNNDSSCKWISNKCTTNGSNCVGITLCSETNTDGGCVTGYDGACIQSVPDLNSSDPKVCKPYTSCADAFYTTHSDCQIASSKCTTNGTTGCIALGSCSSYTVQAGCYFNDKGTLYTSGVITSTGICTWDTTSSSCRDQSCADLTGTTHATCSSQLSTCTSDGTTCLLKGACTSYTTQTACTTAVGSDGACYWELASATNNNTAKCRLLTCADIQNGTATNVCSVALSTCVSNGTACIPKANCSTYTSKVACNSGGLDGICVFTQSTATGAAAGTGTCALMTACTVANNDQTACQAARDRCSWTAASGTRATAVASKCATHTCATNQATNGACTRFLNWDKKTQQVCTLVSGACTATDPSSFSSNDCFLVSGYTYTCNASTSKCGVCTAVVVQPNTTDNNTNTTDNNTTTDSGYILGLSIVLGYLMF